MRGAVLWLVAAGCVPKARYLELEASYDEAVAERDRAASEGEACVAEVRDAGDRARAEAERFEAGVRRLRELGVGEVVVEGDSAALRFRADELFVVDTADLSPEGERAVGRLARALAEAPEARFRVEGWSSGTPTNTREFPTALHLGADRAITLVQALIAAGVGPQRLWAASSAYGVPPSDLVDLVWLPAP